ncbi:dolichol-phosphate mannosyltransferase [Acetobacter estunensis NRIC 0472]|uniref:Glycosyltransferase n=1 Tax=Acetobacter estunensis TaxID=104097 RepID=A0A967EB19_9PROT|nr:glycosyltransferase family 2 protein [Acetobacter estunensis]NHO52973.1 glycosyltransferase [Acetobacter estunensis]GBQ29590.1 dolichol-phosphate mannosyltransferase [Acetobacter estunensis NRIC 0472]
MSVVASRPTVRTPVQASVTRIGTPDITVVVPCYREAANVRPLVEALTQALTGRDWEVVFVDDNSPDGTIEVVRQLAQTNWRVRGISRIGRRGLSTAVIEGALSSSAPYIAVMDGDLQHDESRLGTMIDKLAAGECDIVVGSRHVEGGDNSGLANAWRHALSDGGIRLAQMMMPVKLSDPMSGFFALRRDLFVKTAPRLSGAGFKILMDLILSAPGPVRVEEVPCVFRPRLAGESKLDFLVLLQFLALILDKLFRGWLPIRFIAFALVGAVGVVVNILVMEALRLGGVGFGGAQSVGTIVAMLTNFWLDNTFTYRDRRLKGARMWGGLIVFLLVCSIGAWANIGVATLFLGTGEDWSSASAAGAVIGVVWNYAVSSTLIWRSK